MDRLWTIAVMSLLVGLSGPATRAQEATPAADGSLLAAMGYPELLIRVIDDAYEMPATVPAGRTLITLENAGAESWHGFLLRLPDGVSVEEALASPEAGQEDAPPPWLFESHYPGFPGETLPGERRHAVVDLTPGVHLVVGDSFQPFEVVGESGATPAAGDAPAADGTVRLFEYGFQFPDAVAPGRQVWEIVNAGREPHELLLAWSPVPVTPEQILELFAGESEDEDATPTGGGPSFADIEPVGGMGWLSPGVTAWAEVDVRPGTYVALCFVFDPATGMPHVMLGMIDVFTVDEAGTPEAATPAA